MPPVTEAQATAHDEQVARELPAGINANETIETLAKLDTKRTPAACSTRATSKPTWRQRACSRRSTAGRSLPRAYIASKKPNAIVTSIAVVTTTATAPALILTSSEPVQGRRGSLTAALYLMLNSGPVCGERAPPAARFGCRTSSRHPRLHVIPSIRTRARGNLCRSRPATLRVP